MATEKEATSEVFDYERSDLPMWERHEKWMASVGRVYKDEAEKARRLKTFTETVEYIESFNKQEGQTYSLGINEFTDLTPKEMRGWCVMTHGVRAGKDGEEELVEYSDNEEEDLEHLEAQSKPSTKE
ncbi:ervatamin-B-like protein [Cinnamomum micranthum f. kanehirae]|uniref:Ervatamin-B-like protein n=1 Tax=Cinnamomum micranthum f. kanehirae TaxID=337451 RepID=A0A443Q2Z7_9MAGN|nr:ervatamin-B-like protein [Cinnamomum micranthum f. kanehirae]